MKKTLGIVLLLCLFVSFCLILLGCKSQSIDFKRESKYKATLDKYKNKHIDSNKNYEAKKSSGIVIYKDKRYGSNSSVNFGPNDINFDLDIK